jgi:ABC-type transport system involved in cytochrome c biogenesis permease subunit
MKPQLAAAHDGPRWARWLPLIMVVVFGLYLASKAVPPRDPVEGFDVHRFARLPVVYQGRVKPYDTLARNSLLILTDRQSFVDASGNRKEAIIWLLDVIAGTDAARTHPIFRIEHPQILHMLGLEERPGFRYALNEFAPKLELLDEQGRRVMAIPQAQREVFDNKLAELIEQLRLFMALTESFSIPQLNGGMEQVKQVVSRVQMLKEMGIPHAVPPATADGQWQPFIQAAIISMVSPEDRTHALIHLSNMLVAWSEKDAAKFNAELAEFEREVHAAGINDVNPGKLRFEAAFNHAAPFYYTSVIYVFVFILTALGWLGFTGPLNRSALWLVGLALIIHTAALIARIYLSGRPPVTNLYSSAVFIGWGCVIFGFIFERIWKMGVGNLLAGIAGFITLLIAHHLAMSGDTLETLQAVLDTNFWLATHVTTVTMGYVATYIAGLLGIIFILRGVFTRSVTKPIAKSISAMLYGTLCFALLFSFIGTVLGGLWADDSWGRFWGWDPKENGALIIVLWNALILHARWAGLAQQRGIAILAIGGNIVTTWSWFGVNMLGVGLHSYGFMDSAVFWMMFFAASQIAIMIIGLIPMSLWRSFGPMKESAPPPGPGPGPVGSKPAVS